jgi:hypothetical protein
LGEVRCVLFRVNAGEMGPGDMLVGGGEPAQQCRWSMGSAVQGQD